MKIWKDREVSVLRDEIDEMSIVVDFADGRDADPFEGYEDEFFDAINEEFIGEAIEHDLAGKIESFAVNLLEKMYQDGKLHDLSVSFLPN